jgi:hypothetical protein
MARYKMNHIKTTVADAVSNAFSDLNGLAEEIREVVDNASGTNFENTQRIQTLDETASTLEGLSEPEINENMGKLEVEYRESLPSGRKGLSRRMRCENAISALDAAIAVLQEKADELGEGDQQEEYEGLVNELEDIKGNAETCEFPGMYG